MLVDRARFAEHAVFKVGVSMGVVCMRRFALLDTTAYIGVGCGKCVDPSIELYWTSIACLHLFIQIQIT